MNKHLNDEMECNIFDDEFEKKYSSINIEMFVPMYIRFVQTL
jgi:hypothetical protein